MTDNANKKTSPNTTPITDIDLAAESVHADERSHWTDEFSDGVEISPEKFSNLDFFSALDEMNAAREAMFFEPDDSEPEQAPPQISEELLIQFAKENGISAMVSLFKEAMNRLGYVKDSYGCFLHRKSGITIKF